MNQEKEFLKIARLIANEISDSISDRDYEYLQNWINESEQNKDIYNEMKKEGWYAANEKLIQKYKKKEGWSEVNPRIHSTTKIKRLSFNVWRYAAAAVFVGILVTGYLFRDNFLEKPSKVVPVIVNTIKPGTDKATLTLEDGSIVELEKGNAFQTKNANSDGKQIIYKEQKRQTELVYNYITIPRGGQFHIILSDGTGVWLNSESQLKYPVNFIKEQTRQVELVYGEAYFDVSSNGAKFKVLNNAQEVEVLGTEFNIKTYKDETNIYTTIVEGSVAVYSGSEKYNLSPNQQSNLNLQNSNVSIAQVDANAETSWRRGVFSFRGKPLKDVMKVISRWYDVDIVFVNKDLESVKFRGVIKKQVSIEEILTIMKSSSINGYDIDNKTVILR